jgi:lysophospholipase L1-like esterase
MEHVSMKRTRRLSGVAVGAVISAALSGGCVDLRVPDPNVRYVAFGDSSTRGPSDRDYPDILREKLGVEPETFANEGHGGETSDEGLDRLSDLLAMDIFPNAEVLLYWEGGNDMTDLVEDVDPFLLYSPMDADFPHGDQLDRTLDEVQANIQAAIQAGRNAGWDVYVATYYLLREDLDICEALPLDIILPVQAANANDYVRLLNERIRRASRNAGAGLIDVAALDNQLRADPDNYFNCNHLSAQGNILVADLFADALEWGSAP